MIVKTDVDVKSMICFFFKLQARQRKSSLDSLTEELNKKLEKAGSQEEVDKILADHDQQVADAMDKIENNKRRQMQDLLQRLAQKRDQREAAMKRQHRQEAEEAGIKLEVEKDENAFDRLLEQGIALELLFAEEASGKASALAEQNKKLGEQQQAKMSENLSNAMVSI